MLRRLQPAVAIAIALWALPAAGPAGRAQQDPPHSEPAVAEAVEALAPRYRQWLASVQGLITPEELRFFLGLRQDYRRDAFMEAFWEPRDPDPRTRANELRERWQQALSSGGGLPYGDPRFLLYLLNGPPGGYYLPDGRHVARCFSKRLELEIWFYGASERTAKRFLVIFVRRTGSTPFEIYRPGDPFRPLPRTGRLPTTDIAALCADDYLRWAAREIARSPGYERLLQEVLSPPVPSAEWLANLKLGTTELPAGAETVPARVDLGFPARRQSRTAVRVLLAVPRAEAPGRSFDGETFHNFVLTGEVIRDGRLFESFSYRFEGPTPEGTDEIPLGFTRYLRPGPATLRLLLEDVFSGRFAQVVRELEVPSPEGLPADPDPVSPDSLAGPPLAAEGPSLRLLPPPGTVHVGPMRFSARATGEFEKVTFYLDDRPVYTFRKPPYSAELDLGEAPAPHRVRVVGFAGGREVATDQVWLNQGALRFRVRLVEPRAGGIYPGSLTARVDVQTPDGQPPERVELWLNDALAATLAEPPWARGLRLPGAEAAVVRAVAYLADGSAAEDAVLVNAAGLGEAVEVRLVELYALVTDARGRPIRDLERAAFRVFEDDVPQRIRQFQRPDETPLNAALLVDRSASMAAHLDRVTEAAVGFLQAAARTPEDRLAVFSFADEISLDARFTAAAGQLERALAGLSARGGTALYDSLVQAFRSFEGLPGQKALVLFSDGQDESSRLGFEQVVEAARRARVTLWAVGLEAAFPDRQTRRSLRDLAAATGGEAWFLADLGDLAGVYRAILEQLRARYLLAYQSTSDRPAGELRSIRVMLDREGAAVRARDGYYP